MHGRGGLDLCMLVGALEYRRAAVASSFEARPLMIERVLVET